jgi:carboxyl-terminal processing protease
MLISMKMNNVMMGKLTLLFLFLLPVLIEAQPKKVKSVLDKTIERMKQKSLHTKEVNWDTLTAGAYRLAREAKRPEELGKSIRYLFQSLDDFHGSFRYKDSVFRWVKEKVTVPETYKAAFATKGNKFFTRQMEEAGYLRIPTSLVNVAKERTRALQDSLCKILSRNPKGLIFDLRLNGGGHFFCMAMGISNILEYGFINTTDEMRKDGYYRTSASGTVNIHPFKETCERNHLDIPIAVIIGPMVGSSAEVLTVLLKNRPNTLLIGEPTAGWVTSVDGMKINRNAHLNLSVSYLTDVHGNVYKTSIQPDILVQGGDNFTTLPDDKKIQKALEWLAGFNGAGAVPGH